MDLGATHLLAQASGLRAMPMERGVSRACARRRGDVSAQGAKARRQTAPRRGICRSARRRPRAAAQAAGQRPARRHDGSAGQRMDARISTRRARWPLRRAFAPKPKWRRLPGVVDHVFTHFPLELWSLSPRHRAGHAAPKAMRWAPLAMLPKEALPNVMRKVIAHALEERQNRKLQCRGTKCPLINGRRTCAIPTPT